MTFEDLNIKYPDRDPAFPAHLPKPNASDLEALIQKYNCKFPQSFIDFQLKFCHKIPLGDFAFEGFGWANKTLDPSLSLEDILKDYTDLEFPQYLTPFRYDNGDFWCFDNRGLELEYPVVIFDHNTHAIESHPHYKWKHFIDWIDKTMERDY